MTSKKKILESLQYGAFRNADPINSSNDPAEVITFKFGGASRPSNFPTNMALTGWQAFTAAEQAVVQDALAHMESFLNVSFSESTGANPDLDFVKVSIPGPVVGYGGFALAFTGSKQNITRWDGFAAYDNTMDFDTVDRAIILHEIAHAMGLRHPFNDNGSPRLPAAEENGRYTVMSYNDNPDTGSMGDKLALYDILALQDIWGEAEANTGDTTYGAGDWVIWDTGGIDTIDGSGAAGSVTIRLGAGKFSSIGSDNDVAVAFGVKIENAQGGAFGDRLIGNGAANVMTGGGGDDLMRGLGGPDRLFGDAGRDTLNGGRGKDHLFGGEDADLLIGGGQRDRLDGQSGNDTLRGGGGADRFVFAAGYDEDRIVDFGRGRDKIVITGLGDKSTIRGLAEMVAGDVVIDFGDGDILIIDDSTINEVMRGLIV